jgi:hypothetical protein
VYTASNPVRAGGADLPAGTFFIRAKSSTLPLLRQLVADKGITFSPMSSEVSLDGIRQLRLPRIALYDQYGGSITSGWLRFIFEQFEFPYEVIFPKALDAGNLNARYDVVILPDGATFAADTSRREPASVPAEYQSHLGAMTAAATLPQLRTFVENGGSLLTIGSASTIAYALKLPVANAVADSAGKALPRSRFYIPGSILSVAVDTTSPIAWGMRPRADIFFDSNPAFRLLSDANSGGIKRVAWFDSAAPLRSGWAWGQKALDGATAIMVAPVGKGNVVLYGPLIDFRSQEHGAFRFLFNGIYYGQELSH